MENLFVLEYQDNFADNISNFAYGEILAREFNSKVYYENNTKKREVFENQMSLFDIDVEYISSSRIENISRKALDINKYFINNKINKLTKKKKTNFINCRHFRINDINKIDDKIAKKLIFSNVDFIMNYDILDDIKQNESVGIYIDKKDVENNNVDFNFIYEATNRINKYKKRPILYIFTHGEIKKKIKTNINYRIISLDNWKEEFYFLTNCKHKIILNSENSYSACIWSAILNNKEYNLNIFTNENIKNKKHNWIKI